MVLVLLAGFGPAVDHVEAANLTKLDGTVYLIDVTAHTVTLKDAGGALTSLNVTRRSRILRNNRRVTLTGLVLGDQVTALYDSSKNATQLGAKGPVVMTVQGAVADVTLGTGTVQIHAGRLIKNAQTTFQTRVIRNGKVASLSSLTLLDSVTAHLKAGSSLSSGTPGVGDALDIQAEGPEESEVSGTIAAVGDLRCPALLPSQVQIILNDGLTCVTLNVTVDTLIEVGGAPATISDLTPGMFVEAKYDPLTFNAFRIEAEEEGEDAEVEGVINAVDTGLGTVTIDSNGTLVTLFVDASTKIELNGETVFLADLAIYLATNSNVPVSAEYNVVAMVAKEIEAGVEPEEEPAPEPEPEPEHD